jgi:hypothetical protein
VIPMVSLREALVDPQLLGNALAGDSWWAWRTLLIAAMGEPLSDDERAIFTRLTGREREPGVRVEELWGIVGRRGGKSRALAALACYLTALCDYSDVLAPGERAVLLCIAPDSKQAGIVCDYAAACFEQAPQLRRLVAGRSTDAIALTTGIALEVRWAQFRRLRGPTYVAVIADEAAFWYSDDYSLNADVEILNAVRPGLATTRGLLAVISSPYARRGEVWDAWRRHYGPQSDPLILVAQGASRDFNPSLPLAVVERALVRDPAAGAAEYLAQFRTDIESFVAREAVEACVAPGVRERPFASGLRYRAFADPSGGSSDSFTLAIAHREGSGDDSRVVIDVVREARPPFSPEAVVDEFAQTLRGYGITQLMADKYAGNWPAEQFQRRGIRYEANARPKSELYRDLLPLLNSGGVVLLHNDRLVQQLCGLERRTARGTGRDIVDHSPGAHDDVANAVAGAALLARTPSYDSSLDWVFGPVAAADVNGSAASVAAGVGSDTGWDNDWQRQQYRNYVTSGGYRRF